MIDQAKINAFLSEKTGMWKPFLICPDCGSADTHSSLIDNSCCGCGHNYSERKELKCHFKPEQKFHWHQDPLDFFTPDGMVRLMEWFARKDYTCELVISNAGLNVDDKIWSVGILPPNRDGSHWKEGTADTPQAALAQAAYQALGGER